MTNGVLQWNGLSTWYRVVGEATGNRLPVVICHGGPGATHDEVEAISDALHTGRSCVLYDQVGNGHSAHCSGAPAQFWTVELFLRELQALLAHLGWQDGYHLIGHSWGGMLGLEHALTHPRGLRSLVLCDTPYSLEAFGREGRRMRDALPSGSPQETMAALFARHICRRQPTPEAVLRTAAQRAENPAVFLAMNGPDPFETVGTLRGWDVRARLSEIEVPTLLASGVHDLVNPAQVEQMREAMPDARCHLFADSSHMPFVEEPERFREVVNAFLADVESQTMSDQNKS